MKGLSLCLAAGLVATVRAVSPAAVYTFDSGRSTPSPDAPSTVSPEAVRLVLAQRLGISRYHELKSIDDVALQQIDKHSGPQRLLFDDSDRGRKVPKLLVMVEGVENIEGMTSHGTLLRGGSLI